MPKAELNPLVKKPTDLLIDHFAKMQDPLKDRNLWEDDDQPKIDLYLRRIDDAIVHGKHNTLEQVESYIENTSWKEYAKAFTDQYAIYTEKKKAQEHRLQARQEKIKWAKRAGLLSFLTIGVIHACNNFKNNNEDTTRPEEDKTLPIQKESKPAIHREKNGGTLSQAYRL